MATTPRLLFKFLELNSHLQIITLLAIAFLLWVGNVYLHPDYLHSQDATIYAQIARNFLEGKGLTTSTALPVHFAYNELTDQNSWPSPYPLLYSLAIALSFKIFGLHDLSIIIADLVFFLATIPILYLLAIKLFDKKVALLASFWYIFNPHLLGYSISGMSESLFILVTVLLFYLLTVKSKRVIVAIGIILALATLTRFQGYLYLLPTLIFLLLTEKKKVQSLALVILGFALVRILAKFFLPALAQDNTSWQTLYLWLTIANGSLFSPEGLNQYLLPITFFDLVSNYALVIKKIFLNIYLLLKDLLIFTVPSVSILYFLSLFKKGDKNAQAIKWFLFSLFIFLLLFHTVTIFDFRYIHPLIPIILIFALNTLLDFFRSLSRYRYLSFTFLFTVAFVILPSFTYNNLGTQLLRQLEKRPKTTIHQLAGQIARENTSPEMIIVSDEAEHLSWYANRRTVYPPRTKNDLLYFDQNIMPVDALLLTNHPVGNSAGEDWDDLVKNPKNFGPFYFAQEFLIKESENYYRVPVKVTLFLKKK